MRDETVSFQHASYLYIEQEIGNKNGKTERGGQRHTIDTPKYYPQTSPADCRSKNKMNLADYTESDLGNPTSR